MSKVGILCEKPSAARNFAAALGGMSGTYNGTQYVIACARGHLFEFVDPAQQVAANLVSKYKSWNPGNLPWVETDLAWKYDKKEGVSKELSAIKAAFTGVDEITCATDVDPSGEGFTIFTEVLIGLNLRPKTISRMYFMDESKGSVQKAFVDRKPVPDIYKHDEYLKAFYRTRWDFCSMQFTRIATAFGDGKSVLRQGRLKSAMVLLVGDQLQAVAKYKKVPYYQNRFKDENGVVYTNLDEPTYPDKNQVPKQYHGSSVTVDDVSRKKTAPPKFLDLAALSARLATKGYKPKQVLDTYQKMYEKQIVSYPRTEDKTITPEQFNDMLPYVDAIARVVGVDPSILTHRQPRSTHVKPQGAHGANRPGLNVPSSLMALSQFGPGAEEIYELLARSYLASLAEDYEYDSQKGHVTDYPKFVGSTQVPKKMGWKAVYDADEVDEDSNASGLGKQAQPFVFEGFPPKPTAPTMKWLMGQLERRDIGTGATRTSTLAEICSEKAKYPLMKESRGKLTLADCGEMSYRLLPGTKIGSLDITKQVQDEMEAIAKGTMGADVCLHNIQDMVVHDIQVMKQNGEKMRKDMGITLNTTSGGNGNMEQAERFEGTFKGKQVSPKRVYGGYRFTDDECEALLRGEKIVITQQGQKGPYKIEGCLAEQTYNGRKFVGFQRLGFVNDNSNPPKSWCEHIFTEDEIRMLKGGQRVALTGCKSKKGNFFDCYVRWVKGDDGKMTLKPEFN